MAFDSASVLFTHARMFMLDRLFALAAGSALATLVFLTPPAIAQQSALTVDKIMQEQTTWVGSSPRSVSWTEDGEWIHFWWNPQGAFPADSLFRVPADGGEPEQVPAAERRDVQPLFSGWAHGSGTYTSDFRYKVFQDDGDLFVLDRTNGALERLTATVDAESGARFTPDGTGIVFQRGGQVYRLERATGRMVQLTNLRSGKEPVDRKKDDAQDAWLRQQQEDLFEVVREQIQEREARDEERERDQAQDHAAWPPEHFYGDGFVVGLQVDPSERFAAFQVGKRADDKRTLVQNYVTESGYAEDLNARSKVGVEETGRPLFIQDLTTGDVVEVDFTQLPGAYDVVPAHRVQEGVAVDSSKARVVSASGPFWSPDGTFAVLDIFAEDNKDRWIARLDPSTGDLTVLDRQQDEAWIGGPGVRSWSGGIGWLPDGRTIHFQSEKTGYSHLYTMDVVTGAVKQLTDGPFEVFSPQLSKDGKTWFFTSSEGSPFERHLYRMPVAGGQRTRLTETVGNHDVAIHPDGERAAVLYSFTTQPPDLYVKAFGRPAERITTSTTAEWRAYPWRTGEIVHIPASDGAELPTQIFLPERPNGAAVLFVHGAGYLQNVHRWWSSYQREYMFHNMLADMGYTVLNVDYRASSGYGRDWRTAIYRWMGGRDLQDYVDASAYVGREHGIDPERVFIYGGSYGGFITLMALFTEPEHFGGGAALRSVTDWAHYNHGYTSNILNTPVTDSLAYVQSSPIYFADGLEDPLLMAHGVIDTNVQYQDIIRLTQRLIELGKTDWELASYPVEGHGFTEPSSWTDEYRRILELIQRSVGPD